MLPSFECCSRERPSSSLDEVPFETLTKEPGEHLPTRWGQGGDTWGFTEPEDSAHQAFDLGADAGGTLSLYLSIYLLGNMLSNYDLFELTYLCVL